MMPTYAHDNITTLNTTICASRDIVRDIVAILSSISSTPSALMATDFAGCGGHIVNCRVQFREVR
jgi:hypothetical protein